MNDSIKELQVAVISDVHLGTYGCHAKELLTYLKSIDPKYLVLNGDIFDIWNFSKNYFPVSHMEVIQQVLHMIATGTKVIYITGNHDEVLRRYSGTVMGNLEIVDKLVLDIKNKKVWFFHGDIFDVTTQGKAKLIAKLGGKGYDMLILLNRAINSILEMVGKEKMSLSKKIKDSIKKAVTYINNFEQTAAEIAIEKGFDYVVCGHIHKPQIKTLVSEKGQVTYLNSGDWVENLSALELRNNEWSLYIHSSKKNDKQVTQPQIIEKVIEKKIVEKILS